MSRPAAAGNGESVKEQANVHPLEWDLLGYVDGNDDATSRPEIERHVSGCPDCRKRANGLLRLVQRLSDAKPFLQPEQTDDAQEPWRKAVTAARERLDAEVAARGAAEEAVRVALDASPRLPIGKIPGLSASHLIAAREIARGLHSEPAAARGIVEWALDVPDGDVRPTRSAEPAGVRGMLLTTRGNVSRIEGYPKRALADLDLARPLLEDGLANPDIEIAYWWWVRAQAIQQRGDFGEALAADDRAEQIYALYGDAPWIARCRANRAILFSNLGRRSEAIAIYESLLASGDLEPRVLESTQINLAFELVLSDRFDEARSRYALATQLLLGAGQEHRLIRVRAGLAEIARREGHLRESIEILRQLQLEYRLRGLAREEVVGELDIASALCEMGRTEEARGYCRAAHTRAVELGFAGEVVRALEVLASTSAEASPARNISSIRDFVRGFESNREETWSAA